MPPITLFIFFVLIIAVALVAIWRYWYTLARVSPEEEEFDERMAALNERQANRLSDEQLTTPLSDDDAWDIMVRRGMRGREARRRPTRALDRERTPTRRDRYGGDLARRIDERRDRSGEARPRAEDERAE